MKRTTRKLFICALCVMLAAVMFSILVFNVLAAENSGEKLYVKDVKLIYADDQSKARAKLPAGYKLLGEDLNRDTGESDVYLAYSTTSNPEEAITDIKMMNMNGGFAYSDYNEQIEKANGRVKEIASGVKEAATAFRENYKKGTYGAMAAYRTLSFFTVDEADGKTLADYIIYSEPGDDFYIKLILNAHQNILAAILSGLTMAVQGEKGDTWLDRLAKIKDPDEIEEQPDYWDKAYAIWTQFYSFYDTFSTIDLDLFKTGDGELNAAPGEDGTKAPEDVSSSGENPSVDITGTEALYVVAYKTLQEYSFGNGIKFDEWFLDPDLSEEMLYCLIEVMTPAEFTMLQLCGPLNMILSTGMDASVYNDYLSDVEEIAGEGELCSVWTGVNVELFHSSIGITDAANRAIAETKYEQGLNNDGDSTVATGLRTAGFIASCGAISLGVGLIAYYSFGSFFFTCFSGTALTVAASNVALTGMIFGMAAIALGVAVIIVAVIVALVFFFIWLFSDDSVDYTTIPEYMYDFVEDTEGNTQFLLYEGVTFQDGRVADVNVWEGKEWHAMYVSRAKAAGAPIEADFMVKYDDGRIDTGYAGLSTFGQVNAENLNFYAEDDDVDSIYVTYRQADLHGAYARGAYLSDLKLFSDKDANKCKLKLKNEGFALYDYNLTPDSDYYTYLGCKTTNSASRALTDVRLTYGYSAAQYAAGGGSKTYAASGSTGDGKITLYTTRISQFGSPIRSQFTVTHTLEAPYGYEPVNLFSGGPAVNLNLEDGEMYGDTKPYYIYFLPSVTYTSGAPYIGGLATIFDKEDADDNGLDSVEKAASKLGYKTFFTSVGDDNCEGAVLYTVTYNPYRAIYGVSAVSLNDEMGKMYSQIMNYDGVGYSVTLRLLVDDDGELSQETDFDETGDAKLYVAGTYPGGTPMVVSDLLISNDRKAPTGYSPVYARMSGDTSAVDLAQEITKTKPMYAFVSGEGYKEGSYVTSIVVENKDRIIGDIDLDCDELDNSYLVNALGANNGHILIGKNLNLADSNNTTYVAYTKQHSDNAISALPITNLILYYAKDSETHPEEKMVFDNITYHRIGDINLFAEENEEDKKCKRVYLFYTTNPAAGSAVLDIRIDNNPILDGWETVRTQNKKALNADMDAYGSSMWYIHMKRNVTEPKYISEIVIGIASSESDAKAKLIAAGCDYMLQKDLNNNVGLWSDYIYLGYKRTSNPDEAIRGLRTTHNYEVTSFVLGGLTFHKIDGNLNSDTTIFADNIYLYYTKDKKAGTPITSLGTSASVANWSHGEGYRYTVNTVLNKDGLASDLNKGVAGDTIYLLQTRDRQDQSMLASMVGNGSLGIITVLTVIALGGISAVFVTKGKHRKKSDEEELGLTENEQ